MTGGVAPGWYPDYEAPTGHQRYWDGQRWTEQRADAATAGAVLTATKEREPLREAPPRQPSEPVEDGSRGPRWAVWLAVLAAVVVVIGALAFVVVRDWSGSSDVEGSSSPPPASEPGPPESGQDDQAPESGASARTWEVAAVVDGTTIELTNGAQVRLDGLADSCSPDALAQLVDGQRVTLVRKGADKDAEGHLVRYVEREGLDVGLRLIQRGFATASSEPNARGTIYRKVDARSPSAC